LYGLQAHLSRVGEDRCAFVRAMVFANKAMASRSALAQQAQNWLKEAGTLPPGNGVERELWEVHNPHLPPSTHMHVQTHTQTHAHMYTHTQPAHAHVHQVV
jgi:hypothetical protein